MRYDRLSALIQRFSLGVAVSGPGAGNMRVFGTPDGAPVRVEFSPSSNRTGERAGERVLIEANVDWGGTANPLIAALPGTLELKANDGETASLLHVFLAEARDARCGSDSALSRLAEVLVIRMLRAQIGKGSARPGLVAGLADPRLSRAIVAMHDQPGRTFGNRDLAEIAGMSLSRFCDVFHDKLGLTPQAYLRQWRMILAHQDLDRGDRVQSVARRYGYGSPEALTRAYQRHYGSSPTKFTKFRKQGRAA